MKTRINGCYPERSKHHSTDVMDMKMDEFQTESGTVMSPRPHVLLGLPIRDVSTLSRNLKGQV